MFSGCKHSISPPPQQSPSPHHNTRGEALLLTSEVPQLLPEVIDLENDNITSTSRLLENDESARTESIAQTPLLNEPVTGPLNIGASVVADVAVLHKPVTDLCNTAQSVVDMREPSAAPIDLSTGTVSVVLPEVVPEAFSVPFKVRVDDTDTDIVDFETFSDSEGSTLPTSDSIRQEQVNGHAEGIVRAWNDYEITGLKIMRGTANLADALSNVTRHFFYNNNKPKPGLFWTDLFSNNVIPTVHRNDETGESVSYYENSTRATVPLFDWVRGRSLGDPKFANHSLSDEAVRDIRLFEEFVVNSIMPQLGFDQSVVQFNISGMSILLQPPVGGISQVMHTDDYPESVPGEWISLLFPCHQQRGTVFLRKLLSNAFGSAVGVKPFFNIGDVAAWSTVKHFGSGAEAVDPHMLLRSAVFVFVHVTPVSERLPERILPVTGGELEGNRDENGQEVIQYGPDEIHWTGGLVPIIRVCVCCLNGVNCDYETQFPSQQQCPGQQSTSLMFCTQCAALQSVHDGQARVRALICQWCKDNDTFFPVGAYPDMDTSTDPFCVISWLYESVMNAKLCTHGKVSYQPLPIQDLLFVLFSHDEIASSCQFWVDFFTTYHFTEVYAPIELSQDARHWNVFWELFLSNSTCTRARILCWIGAIIGGIGPVFSKKDKLYHGGYPVFYPSKVCHRDAASNAYVNVLSSCDNGIRLLFQEARLLKLTRRIMSYVKQTYWEYSMRCQCHVSASSCTDMQGTEGNHRVIKLCSGPILRRTVTQASREVEPSEKDLVDRFELKCRELWTNSRVHGAA